ncbi:MAG TPA: class I SAM-dependent methyltransferase [Bryobacteraceae bacterium]|jgi:malonyl-CoA O-methyltransferase|nr:class I SAM-dependent methyltransferase [Bryobacteraceae bacterium]
MAIRLPPLEAYRLWSQTWEGERSPVVALESRWVAPWLTGLRGKLVLDLGCGAGRWLAHAQSLGARVYGADPCRQMLLEAAKKPGLPGRLVEGGVPLSPFAPGCADMVLCALVLGHVNSLDSAVMELARLVRPGGRLIVTDFHPQAIERGWRRTFRSGGHLYEVASYPYGKARLLQGARAAGLTLEEILEPGFDEPERPLFESAGKAELFGEVRGLPALLLARWTRP